MIVVDAGVLVTALADDTGVGRAVRERLATEDLVAPELVDLEVASALRTLVRRDVLDHHRAAAAIADLGALAMRRVPHLPLLDRCWALRANVTVYDAAYVALAERLSCRLLTADRRLAAAPGTTCEFEVISTPS